MRNIYGIKVRLESGEIGRVKEVSGETWGHWLNPNDA